MTTPNTNTPEEEINPIDAIKRAIGLATFKNSTEVGGIVFKLLDSLSQDLIFAGMEFSERTEDYTQELIDVLAEDISEYATPELEEEDDDEDEDEDDIDVIVDDIDDDDDDDDEDDNLTDEEEDNFMEDSANEEEESNGVSYEGEVTTN